MSESPSHLAPGSPPVVLDGVEWLASGARSGMLRVHGRVQVPARAVGEAPVLILRDGAELHRHTSLRDVRSEDGGWRAAYVLAGERLQRAEQAWLEWPDGIRIALPEVETQGEHTATGSPLPAEPAGEVIDRAVLAERRAQRAEAAQRAQARATADALAGLAALERRLEQLTSERDALAADARTFAATEDREAPAPVRLVPGGAGGGVERVDSLLAELQAARAARAADEPAAEARGSALAGAREALDQLKRETAELRVRLRALAASAGVDAVRLAVSESERGQARARLDSARAEVGALRERLAREQRERGVDARALRAVHARVAGLKGQRDELRIALDGERLMRRQAERRAAERAGARAELEALRREMEEAASRAAVEAGRLRVRVQDLSVALEAAHGERAAAVAAADAARHAERAARTESGAGAVARAAAERERRARARAQEAHAESLRRELAEQRSARWALTGELERERQARRRAAAEAQAQRAAAETAARRADDLRAEVEALTARGAGSPPAPESRERIARLIAESAELRSRIAALQEKLTRTRRALEAAEEDQSRAPADDLKRRMEALQSRAREEDLQERVREQLEAAAAVRPRGDQADRLVAQLDAAAAALRARVTPVTASGDSPAGRTDGPSPIVVSARELVPRFRAPAPRAWIGPQPPSAARLPRLLRPAARLISQPLRPAGPAARLVTEPLRRRERAPETLASLRGALVRLAHDDAFSAARVLASLLSAQGAFLDEDIDYDVTIHELGCFAVTVAEHRSVVRALRKPRPRRQAELHVAADAVTLAELLAGRRRRVGRVLAPVRLRGPRERFAVLERLGTARASLGDVVRAGARLDPWLVMRVLPQAIDPAWTAGHSFTVAQEITGAHPQTWYIAVDGRAGISVSPIRPVRTPDARVSMPRGTFDRLLAGDSPDPGQKPWVWGDFAAVDRLRGWAERARA